MIIQSKAQQAADAIRQALKEGRWSRQVPGENRLADTFKLSRPTIRRALEILTSEGVLEMSERGRARRVSRNWRDTAQRPNTPIGVLTREPLDKLMPAAQSGFRELRKIMESKGHSLSFHTSPAWNHKRPGTALGTLMDKNPMSAWLINDPTPSMLVWLEMKQIPCLSIGGDHDYAIPNIGSNGQQAVRQATRELIEFGHREICYPLHEHYGAEMVKYFVDELGTIHPDHPDERHTPSWGGHAVECFAMLERLFTRPQKPTAFVTLGLTNLLPILTWLGANGYVAPRDVSIVHILHDPILDRLYPPISHYRANTKKLIQQTAKILIKLAKSETPMELQIMGPVERVEGRSIGPASGG